MSEQNLPSLTQHNTDLQSSILMSYSGSISESLCRSASVLSLGVSLGLSLEIEIASSEHYISILYTTIGKAGRASFANH